MLFLTFIFKLIKSLLDSLKETESSFIDYRYFNIQTLP